MGDHTVTPVSRAWMRRRGSERLRASVDYVWILDSDAVVLRADTLARGLAALNEAQAALATLTALPEAHSWT